MKSSLKAILLASLGLLILTHGNAVYAAAAGAGAGAPRQEAADVKHGAAAATRKDTRVRDYWNHVAAQKAQAHQVIGGSAALIAPLQGIIQDREHYGVQLNDIVFDFIPKDKQIAVPGALRDVQDSSCVICLESLSNERKAHVGLQLDLGCSSGQAKHRFHYECVLRNIKEQRSNNAKPACPACRTAIAADKLKLLDQFELYYDLLAHVKNTMYPEIKMQDLEKLLKDFQRFNLKHHDPVVPAVIAEPQLIAGLQQPVAQAQQLPSGLSKSFIRTWQWFCTYVLAHKGQTDPRFKDIAHAIRLADSVYAAKLYKLDKESKAHEVLVRGTKAAIIYASHVAIDSLCGVVQGNHSFKQYIPEVKRSAKVLATVIAGNLAYKFYKLPKQEQKRLIKNIAVMVAVVAGITCLHYTYGIKNVANTSKIAVQELYRWISWKAPKVFLV